MSKLSGQECIRSYRIERRAVRGIGDVLVRVLTDPAMPGYDYLGHEDTGIYDSQDKRKMEKQGYRLLSGPYGVEVYRRQPDKL